MSRSAQPPLTAADYDAIEAAIMETRRGRWFLSEFARRSRHSDTATLLAAFERMEAAMSGNSQSSPWAGKTLPLPGEITPSATTRR